MIQVYIKSLVVCFISMALPIDTQEVNGNTSLRLRTTRARQGGHANTAVEVYDIGARVSRNKQTNAETYHLACNSAVKVAKQASTAFLSPEPSGLTCRSTKALAAGGVLLSTCMHIYGKNKNRTKSACKEGSGRVGSGRVAGWPPTQKNCKNQQRQKEPGLTVRTSGVQGGVSVEHEIDTTTKPYWTIQQEPGVFYEGAHRGRHVLYHNNTSCTES